MCVEWVSVNSPQASPEVLHRFMCENVGFKQKFLLQTTPLDTCLFRDAVDMFGDERMCLKHCKKCVSWFIWLSSSRFVLVLSTFNFLTHWVLCLENMCWVLSFGFWAQTQNSKLNLAKDLPDEDDLFGLNGGFSCKSFSKMHESYSLFQTALHDDNEDSIPMMTSSLVIEHELVIVFPPLSVSVSIIFNLLQSYLFWVQKQMDYPVGCKLCSHLQMRIEGSYIASFCMVYPGERGYRRQAERQQPWLHHQGFVRPWLFCPGLHADIEWLWMSTATCKAVLCGRQETQVPTVPLRNSLGVSKVVPVELSTSCCSIPVLLSFLLLLLEYVQARH